MPIHHFPPEIANDYMYAPTTEIIHNKKPCLKRQGFQKLLIHLFFD